MKVIGWNVKYHCIISPPGLASCRRCTTCEQKEEPSPRQFADFCAPTVPACWGPETPGLQGSTGFVVGDVRSLSLVSLVYFHM